MCETAVKRISFFLEFLMLHEVYCFKYRRFGNKKKQLTFKTSLEIYLWMNQSNTQFLSKRQIIQSTLTSESVKAFKKLLEFIFG